MLENYHDYHALIRLCGEHRCLAGFPGAHMGFLQVLHVLKTCQEYDLCAFVMLCDILGSKSGNFGTPHRHKRVSR